MGRARVMVRVMFGLGFELVLGLELWLGLGLCYRSGGG